MPPNKPTCFEAERGDRFLGRVDSEEDAFASEVEPADAAVLGGGGDDAGPGAGGDAAGERRAVTLQSPRFHILAVFWF